MKEVSLHRKIIKIIHNAGISRKFPKCAEVHNSGTEHATELKLVPKCELNNHLPISTHNSISPKKWNKRLLIPSSSNTDFHQFWYLREKKAK